MKSLPKERQVASFVNPIHNETIIDALRNYNNTNVSYFDNIHTTGAATYTPELADTTVKTLINGGYCVFALSMANDFDINTAEALIKAKMEGLDIMIIIISSTKDIISYSNKNSKSYYNITNNSDIVLFDTLYTFLDLS